MGDKNEEKIEERRIHQLPTAATAEAARKAANQRIQAALDRISGKVPINMDVDGNPGTSGLAQKQQLQAGVAGNADPPTPSGRYSNIMIQRTIRGEHAQIGCGPSADCFSCGSFFNLGDSRIQQAMLKEDARKLLVSTSSFRTEDWSCVACSVPHKLLPRRRNFTQWTKGRQLVILSDQNMAPVLPSANESCPAIIRVEGGLLCELTDAFIDTLGEFTMPEGSVILIGSLTHLMEEGQGGYARGLVKEYRRLSHLFQHTVHIVPFLPPALGGTNDPALIRYMMDISIWIQEVQKWDFSDYYSALRAALVRSADGTSLPHQHSQRHRLPASLEDYTEKVRICHPWEGIGEKLEALSLEEEKVLIYALMEGLNNSFKWNRDVEPVLSRNTEETTSTLPACVTPAVVIGGSNAGRLSHAFKDVGREVISLDCPGWTICAKAVDTIAPQLQQVLSSIDKAVPVVLYCLDNSIFKATNADGDLISLTRSDEDRQYHVVGDLAITPFSVLSRTLAQVDSILELCKGRKVFIMSPIPRYILMTCCSDKKHCANVCEGDTAAAVATKGLLRDLSELNDQLSRKFTGNGVTFVETKDLLTGKQGCSKKEMMNAMLDCWSNDCVHGDKIAYSKLAMGLLDLFSKQTLTREADEDSLTTRKRSREDEAEQDSSNQSRYHQRRDSAASVYSSWPGDNRRGRGGQRGQFGGNRRVN